MIYFKTTLFPPSINNVYFNKIKRTKGGKRVPIRVLTSEGRKYKREFQSWLAKEHTDVLKFFSSPHGEYELIVAFYFKDLYNKGWPKQAKSRHKKFDVSNYLKVAEDSIVEACGHDDSQHLNVGVLKNQLPPNEQEPYIEVWAWNLEEEDGPIEMFMHRRQR